MPISAHIYTFSRLVHASPSHWEQLLSSMEEGKTFAFRYYLPMREAVVKLCSARGKGRDQIVPVMLANARAVGGQRGAKIAKNNADAFEVFETAFFPTITRYRHHFLRQKRSGVVFEGLALEGAPHFEAVDGRGKTRHVFLHAAKWPEKDLAAYLELLGIIVEKDFGGDPSSIWVMDLRNGKEIKWRSSARVRRRCQSAAKLYARLVGAVQAP